MVLVVCAIFINACGGGGGGTPTPAMTLSQTSVSATSTTGTSVRLSIVATLSAHAAGTLYVKLSDPNGVLQPDATLTPGTGESYTIGLTTPASLEAGHYTGSFQVSLCYDTGCSQPVAGSPAAVAFDFTVVSAYTLTPSVLSETLTAGSPGPVTFTVMPATPFSGPVFVSLADPGSVLATAKTVTANSNGSYSITVQPASSLPAGHLTGTLSLNLCNDAGCASALAGSPVPLPYDFTIAAPPPAVTLSPASADATFTAGDSNPFLINLSASVVTGISFPVYVQVSDSTGTFLSTAKLASEPANHFTLTLQANPALAAGHYTGSFQLNVCHDQGCLQPVPGSPVPVAFNIRIATNPNSGLTTLTPWPGIADWETFQRDAAHTGFVPVTLDPTVFATRWQWTAPNADLSTVTTGGGRLYMNSHSVTYALSEFDHSIVWQRDFSSLAGPIISPILNPPAVSGGKTFVATSIQQVNFLYVLNAADGSALFQSGVSSQGELHLAPTVDNGGVFVNGGAYGGIYGFDVNTGAQSFFTQLPQLDEWTPAVDANYAYAYVGQPGQSVGQLDLIDRHNGTLLASIVDTDYQLFSYSLFSAPVLGRPGSVFAVDAGNTNSNELLAFDTQARSVRWRAVGAYSGNPAYAASVLYAVNSSPYRLEALSESDGTLLWSWAPQPLKSETRFIGDVLATNNLVFVSTNTTTYAISQSTHQPVWSIPVPGRLALSANGVLYVVAVDSTGKTNGTVLAVNVKD